MLTKLLYEFKAEECDQYVDFCSSYPKVQYYKDTQEKYLIQKSLTKTGMA